MARKPDGERRVYVLPGELLQRVRAYQERMHLGSEVEAVRRLLDEALQRRDDVHSILDKFIERSRVERDIKMLAREILSSHPLVKEISYGHWGVKFTLENGDYGKFSHDLQPYQSDFVQAGDFMDYKPQTDEGKQPENKTRRIKDLDDDIPF